MPRVPVRILPGGLGSRTPAASGRSTPLPSIRMGGGAAQMRERFAGLEGVSAALARGLDGLQDKIAAAMGLIKRLPFADMNAIEGMAFAGGTPTPVVHGLARQPVGYAVVNIQGAAADFFWSRSTNENRQILLVATVQCTADVWVW